MLWTVPITPTRRLTVRVSLIIACIIFLAAASLSAARVARAGGVAFLPGDGPRTISLSSAAPDGSTASNSRYIYLAAGTYDWYDTLVYPDGTSDTLTWNSIYLAADTYLWTDTLTVDRSFSGYNYRHAMILCGSANNCTAPTRDYIYVSTGTYSWYGTLVQH